MSSLFSVPIFFIIFRETVEAGIIVSVLLSFVDQLMAGSPALKSHSTPDRTSLRASRGTGEDAALLEASSIDGEDDGEEDAQTIEERQRLAGVIRRMKLQIWAGMISGLIIATAIGAAFIAVFYIKFIDLWSQSEQLWEGVFSLVAAGIIFVMGIAFLKMDRARIKWRYKLSAAFEKHRQAGVSGLNQEREGAGGRWALFLLPFVTVIREGLEAVVFVGGVALSVEPSAIPLPTVCGLVLGALLGLLIYRTGSTTTLHLFLICSTTLLFLIGAGLASKGVGFFQYYLFSRGVGGDVAETGDGPGSFMVAGNVWHFECCNPEPGSASTNGFYQLANSVVGWNNTATVGTVGVYIAYWLCIAGTLVWMKWKEGRVAICGREGGGGVRLSEGDRMDSADTTGNGAIS
ncbi:iron permease FTR1/Fip1/EfeU [Dioszegia hungarica]|uniref:Iron permease FTR1/Fip1/EfeU n=1 Tax=Dioszegia hungarica TaxID=4972 RepID=A0AA38H7F6_9TREE|nr:iron permease FTR1/Fip1/EfeU [Dioszegia hungarica]KAI9634956.1 iron permease FTR1/Fip1/EfeU [Dioszegia hungarica]